MMARNEPPAPVVKGEKGAPFPDRERKLLAKAEIAGGSREEGGKLGLRWQLEGELTPADLVDPSSLRELLAGDWGQDLVVRFVVDAAGRIEPEWTCQPELPPPQSERLRLALARVRFIPAGRDPRRGVLRLARPEPPPR